MSGKEKTRKKSDSGSGIRKGEKPRQLKKDPDKLDRENIALRNRIALLERKVQRLITTHSKIGAPVKPSDDLNQEKKLSAAIVNSMPGIFYTLDFTGQFVRWNANLEQVTGYSYGELAAMNALDLFRGEDRQLIAEGIQKVAETDEATVEAEILPKSGHGIPYLFTGRQIEIEGTPHLLGMGIDISERKQAEEELRRYRDHLEGLVAERTAELQSSKHLLDETGRLARVGGWEIDLEKNELNWTDVVRQIHEVGPDYRPELESAINFYAPEAVPVISAAVSGAIDNGHPFDVELQLITAEKKRLWVRAVGEAIRENAKIVKVRGVFQDIDVRKLAELELEKHRDHLEELVNERTEELRENREALIEAQAVARLGSWEWDAVKDEITASAEFYRLFAVVPEQIVRFAQFVDQLHPDDRERIQQDVTAALAQDKPYDTDYRVKLGDGGWRDINARGRVITDSDGKPFRMVGTCLDISERKLTEDKLRESEARYRTLVENIPQKILMKDRNYRWISINENLARDFGFRPEEVVGKMDTDLFPPELAAKYHADDVRIMETGQSEELEERYFQEGRETWVNTIKTPVRGKNGEIVGVLGIFWDISERKQAEDALCIKNQVFEDSIASQSVADKNGVITHVNPAFLHMWGYAAKENAIGKSVASFFANPADATPVLEALAARDAWEGEFLARRTNGSTFFSRGYATSLRNQAGELTGYQSTNLDVTPIREAERQLKALNESLARSNQELEQFAYVASHDLQEPLRMVSSYTQLLAQRYKDKLDQDAKDFIAYAVDGANRMQQLIQDLLEYSRVTTRGRPPERFDAHEVLGEAVKNLQAAIHETGALVSSDELPMLRGDHTQIAQVFQNLIGNSIKFHKPDEPPRVHLSAERKAEQPESWTFKVRDNGIGIEPRHFERLFTIFQRLHGKQEYPGNGIGLALCKRIIERHGGRIWVESEPGKGTNFFFTLPVDGQA